jgi:hypothetical protein
MRCRGKIRILSKDINLLAGGNFEKVGKYQSAEQFGLRRSKVPDPSVWRIGTAVRV